MTLSPFPSILTFTNFRCTLTLVQIAAILWLLIEVSGVELWLGSWGSASPAKMWKAGSQISLVPLNSSIGSCCYKCGKHLLHASSHWLPSAGAWLCMQNFGKVLERQFSCHSHFIEILWDTLSCCRSRMKSENLGGNFLAKSFNHNLFFVRLAGLGKSSESCSVPICGGLWPLLAIPIHYSLS